MNKWGGGGGGGQRERDASGSIHPHARRNRRGLITSVIFPKAAIVVDNKLKERRVGWD